MTDAICEEVRRAKALGLPVVASMGNFAASAGYEVAGETHFNPFASTTHSLWRAHHKGCLVLQDFMQHQVQARLHPFGMLMSEHVPAALTACTGVHAEWCILKHKNACIL